MLWLMLGICLLTLLVATLAILTVRTSERAISQLLQKELDTTRQDFREQRCSWEAERERLLNRALTKEWESYAQMTGAPAASPSDLPPVGMSDETESAQWAARAGALGLGETFVEMPGFDDNDVRGLGLSG